MTQSHRVSGRFLVADPCNVVPEDDWPAFCAKLSGDFSAVDGVSPAAPGPTFVMSTNHGDGIYDVRSPKTGRVVGSFPVDTGLFALIPWGSAMPREFPCGPVLELHGDLTYADGDAFLNGKRIVRTRIYEPSDLDA